MSTKTAPSKSRPRATFLLPCLNESKTLGTLLKECRDTFADDKTAQWTVLVADNGSKDGSQEIAEKAGARVVQVHIRGYGAALNAGIMHSDTEWVVYADADGTYAPADAPKLLKAAIEEGADLAMGSRIKGDIKPGAMPWLHRNLGTPVLSFLIRVLYGLKITDCNSGIRCVRREAYVRWKVRSRGMEFASSLLIKATQDSAKIVEVPVRLRRGPRGRIPHLKRWRDGMRHLLVVLAGAPWLFWRLGLTLLVVSGVLGVPCLWGPFMISGGYRFFGPHTLAVSTIIGFYGGIFFNLALMIYATSPSKVSLPKTQNWLIALPEDLLFWFLVVFSVSFFSGVVYLFYRWYLVDYHDLDFVKWALFSVYLTIIPLLLVLGVFQAHLGKRVNS